MHRPAHDERIVFDQNRPYTIKGYALSGGGRMITRVEVSFDKGALYQVCVLIQLVQVSRQNAVRTYRRGHICMDYMHVL